ncbi:3-isopropylmalate dehydratase small subunit [Mycobacterium sp. CBMA293]|nr:3-isopropylmalate dehydratase small subunit [Mycolicibacterium sp. CBMA 360]MUL57556.1 3-isopropylmalate dehydratase small subunit [Mycolicibacterium sp. CBMA 335]MUL70596.1 3-isopropylmalate dehydratase small subunit [Mycolicibacterium sp. CBMA 311]MUL92644.1 3-isopropylmalate dehydratase small subunit [Mycolicibacterium sp. CBMA 230]MUM08343.1 3-isopropylmalate dehydratase small subunit [Mycolicibacterium sp. CBMA 213]MUM12273.1 3-isopropylmalate dehydratase small subunit [Mycolicibacteri
MQPFTRVTGLAAPLLRANIDTDAISPSHYKPAELSKYGFENALFLDWRNSPDGTTDPDFVLNQDRYRRATILIAGPNFGCGSSRETAVWALRDAGFRAIISPSFALIFQTNCIRNGLLPLALTAEVHQQLVDETFATAPTSHVDINLLDQTVGAVGGPRHSFAIDPRTRTQLINGLDAIGQTLQHRHRIDAFRHVDQQRRPWIYPNPTTKASATCR